MIDLHCHILPGVDDGSATDEESCMMARLAVDSGVTALAATPHCGVPGQFENFADERLMDRFSALERLLEREHVPLRLYTGMEAFVTEQTPRKPATSPYGNTKQMCEDILRDSLAAYPGMKGIALRYFNPIGAHPSALIGELPRGVPQNLVPFITQTAAGLRECLSVFGDDYPTPDGSCIRDYIDVVDLAKAHVAAINRMAGDKNKQAYEIFNVGTGRGVSVLELVHKFEEVNHLKLNYKIAPRRAGDIIAIWADPTLANTELGWTAERTLDQTLAAAWAWEKHIRGIKN